jgi:hypothetical protein
MNCRHRILHALASWTIAVEVADVAQSAVLSLG